MLSNKTLELAPLLLLRGTPIAQGARSLAKAQVQLPKIARNPFGFFKDLEFSASAGGFGHNSGHQRGYIGSGKSVPNTSHLPFEMRGTGPYSGVITAFPEAGSFKAVENYFPSSNTGTGIEYVYDAERNIFAVGKVNHARQLGITGSKHQQLARAINANEETVLGGMFSRGKGGEIILNENSGHYGPRWPSQPEAWQQLIKLLSENLNSEIDFGHWGTSASKGIK